MTQDDDGEFWAKEAAELAGQGSAWISPHARIVPQPKPDLLPSDRLASNVKPPPAAKKRPRDESEVQIDNGPPGKKIKEEPEETPPPNQHADLPMPQAAVPLMPQHVAQPDAKPDHAPGMPGPSQGRSRSKEADLAGSGSMQGARLISPPLRDLSGDGNVQLDSVPVSV